MTKSKKFTLLATGIITSSLILFPFFTKNTSIINCDKYVVERVIDGDTIKVQGCDSYLTIRLLGVNTPETVAPNKDVECYGKNASDYTKNKLTNKSVKLVKDLYNDADRYGRLLRYVELDGVDYNAELVSLGLAKVNGYGHKFEREESYKILESQAIDNGMGLWYYCK